jgi:hypothetical protein
MTAGHPWRAMAHRPGIPACLLAGCAATLTAALSATAALAAMTWTIAPGGAITATRLRSAPPSW